MAQKGAILALIQFGVRLIVRLALSAPQRKVISKTFVFRKFTRLKKQTKPKLNTRENLTKCKV